jgi:hypothetical protein
VEVQACIFSRWRILAKVEIVEDNGSYSQKNCLDGPSEASVRLPVFGVESERECDGYEQRKCYVVVRTVGH